LFILQLTATKSCQAVSSLVLAGWLGRVQAPPDSALSLFGEANTNWDMPHNDMQAAKASDLCNLLLFIACLLKWMGLIAPMK
jgi:hypothetical protein